MTHSRYTSVAVVIIAVVMSASMVINYSANVFGVFNPSIDDRVQSALLFDTNVRLAKAHITADFEPDAVILGSSRAEVGLAPDHPGWDHTRVYNLGLPQASIHEIKEYLRHAIAVSDLKQAVLALDFFQFNPTLSPRPDFKECRLLEPGSFVSSVEARLCDLPTLLFSRKSLLTLLEDESALSSVYLNNGSRGHEAKEKALRISGSQFVAFLRNEHHYFNDDALYLGFPAGGFRPEDGQAFADILELCHAHDVDLRVIISPSHSRQWEVISELGLWQSFVGWKEFLVEQNEQMAAAHGASAFDLWDFADYNTYSQSSPPPIDDSDARMKWYWESSHYTKELGNIVLDRVLLGKTGEMGRRIDSTNLQGWLAEVEHRRLQYRDRESRALDEMRRFLVSNGDVGRLTNKPQA